MINPYAPPQVDQPVQPRVANLHRTSRYLIAMGYVAIAHLAVMCFVSLVNLFSDDRSLIAVIYLTLAICILPMLAYLIGSAHALCDEPRANLQKCRWLAILVGTFYFPFFTWPAYYAVTQLKLYASSHSGDELPAGG